MVEDSILLCHDDASTTNRSPKLRKSVVPSKRPEPIPQRHELVSQKKSVLDKLQVILIYSPLRYMDKSNSNLFYTILYLITQLVNHFLNYFTA